MEIYQLNSFITISETGNLTRAAGIANISQSAMSSQIKALEAELGNSLFIRQAKGMQLTAKGELLLREAKKVVAASKTMQQKALDLQDRISGELNIGINTDPGFLRVSGISRKVSSCLPDVHLRFIESQTFETGKMLQQEKIDVGFHYACLENDTFYSVTLSKVDICVVIPRGMANNNANISLEKIACLPWVWTRHVCPFHVEFNKKLEKENLHLNKVTDAVEENIVRELVKSGAGAALMRKDEARELEKEGTTFIWKGFELNIPLGIACLEKRKTEKIISSFFKTTKAEYNIC